ncbi:MAG: universal stress protein [Desulfosalsimonas sp.]
MKILVEVDQQQNPSFMVRQVAELAGNTWANITFLGICPDEKAVEETAAKLHGCREMLLSEMEGEVSPYEANSSDYRLVKLGKGSWDQQYEGKAGRKDLSFRIRCGNPGKAIVSESMDANADLIIMSGGNGGSGLWPEDTLKKVVRNATCSVLVLKEEKKPQMIVCCLDQDTVTQSSIELINQLVTLYGAELEIVGVTDSAVLPGEVDRRMASILSYYTDRGVKAWVRLVDSASLKSFVAQAEKNNLLALWMGKESLLDRIFSRQRLADMVKSAESSILILR